MTEYAGASHAFANPDAVPVHAIEGAQSSFKCQRREEGGTMLNVETGKPFTYKDSCVGLKSTVGYDQAASEAARIAVEVLLKKVFKLD